MSTVQVKTQLTFDELLRAVEQLSLPDLEQLMSQVIALQAQRKAPNLSKDETNLLLKINQGQSPEVQRRFNELADKRKAETLTSAEHQELIELTEQIEKQEVERVKHMAELARLRGISLTTLMEKLGIERPTYV